MVSQKILVCSVKGGTGKSLFSVSLAKTLKKKGFHVALLDLDLTSPCLSYLTTSHNDLKVTSQLIKPSMTTEGIELISMGLFLPKEETSILLRGIKKAEIAEELINDTQWNSPDYLICDTPAGITDEILTTLKVFRPDRAIIICQADKLSIQAMKKTITMLRRFKIKVAGVVENMSYIKCPKCQEETRLFPNNVNQSAKQTKVKFLGSIPFIPNLKGNLPISEEIVKKVM